MHRIASLYNSSGLFTDGPPGTIVSADWLNAVQEEICYVITQGGQDVSGKNQDTYQQLYNSIYNLIVQISGETSAGKGVIYWNNDTPVAYGERILLLQGQVILISLYSPLVNNTYCGDANNATAPAFFKTSDAAGTVRDVAGPYFVLPDAQGLSLKMIGNATISGRTKTGPTELGEMQEDQFQGHWHERDEGAIAAAGNYILSGSSLNRTGIAGVKGPITDTVNGTPRTGANTRDSSLGTNFGITY